MPVREPTTSNLIIHALLGECARTGIAPADVLREADIAHAALADLESRMPVSSSVKLIGAIARRSTDPAFAIHAAENVPIGAYGAVDLIVANAPSLAAGLERLARYLRLLTDAVTLSYEEMGGTARFRADVAPEWTSVERFVAEFTLACVVARGRRDHPGKLVLKELELRGAQKDVDSELERVFQARIRHECPTNALVFDIDLAREPAVNASPPLSTIGERVGAEMLARLPARDGASAEVRRVLKESFAQSLRPTVDRLARHLGMSRRTLQRRLDAESVSFVELLEQVRRELAFSWLGQSEMSIAEVAFMLGFSQTSAFHRAFRRWTGATPLSFRHRALGTTPGRRS